MQQPKNIGAGWRGWGRCGDFKISFGGIGSAGRPGSGDDKSFSSNPVLCELNKRSLLRSPGKIANADAFSWIKKNEQRFDVIIIDFPDPNFSVGKLYTNTFYKLVRLRWQRMARAWFNPRRLCSPQSYWCINKTLQSAGFNTIPYHNYVPSFGEWGYTMITKEWQCGAAGYPVHGGLKFLNSQNHAADACIPLMI